jgi:hypothetical protein
MVQPILQHLHLTLAQQGEVGRQQEAQRYVSANIQPEGATRALREELKVESMQIGSSRGRSTPYLPLSRRRQKEKEAIIISIEEVLKHPYLGRIIDIYR